LIFLLLSYFILIAFMSAYKFRVLLDSEKDEEIFRDVVIDTQANFETFYRSILRAFEFKTEQMASFYMSNEDWDKGEEITLMDVSDDEAPIELMAQVMIGSKMEDANQKLILVHDFMKMWIFLIELQEITTEKVTEPYVALAVGLAPDENDKSDDFMMDVEFLDEDDSGDPLFDDYEGYDDEDLSDGFESYDEFEY
jgi:hypothetical protein